MTSPNVLFFYCSNNLAISYMHSTAYYIIC